jgi:two-component system OmpR family sensor kinase
VVVALTAVGLLVGGAAAMALLHSDLMERLDAEVSSLARATTGRVTVPGQLCLDPPSAPLPSRFVLTVVTPRGAVACRVVAGLGADPPLPDVVPLTAAEAAAADGERQVVGSVGADAPRWRSLTVSFGSAGSVDVAVSMEDADATLHQLGRLLVAVGVAVLVLVAALAAWAVQVGLRPLTRMEAAAGRIAAGDLSQRVPAAPESTEVGRLALALNTMLARLEESTAARERSQQRLRRFVSDAGHELRTPLTSIRGHAELYRAGAVGDEAAVQRAFARIEAEATRLGVIVTDLLTLARLDEARPLDLTSVDLLAVATDAVVDARAADPQRPIDVRVLEGDGWLDEPPVVRGDDVRLRSLVGNLVANARQHTPAGTPVHVRVGVRAAAATPGTAVTSGSATAPAPAEVIVEVADEGPGLSPADRERVFERFFRADVARSRASGGSGLGLSIVAAVAAAHGGRVEALDAPGGGALFRVTLPTRPRT